MQPSHAEPRPSVLFVVGTRPEAIKLAPVILEMGRDKCVKALVCLTAQHRRMLDDVLQWFRIAADYDLNLMKHDQDVVEFAGLALRRTTEVIREVRPAAVIVQGDTTTVLMAALAAFYERVPVAHVEAGLRTGDFDAPFPEEMNRRLTGGLARWHFAPTPRAADALRAEGVPASRIFVTGNTVVDALQMTMAQPVELNLGFQLRRPRFILVTAHRRESFGAPLEQLCQALADLARRNPVVEIVYAVHPSPGVRDVVHGRLAGVPGVQLVEPLRYEQFVHLMGRATLVLTDSGGIQEEAPVLGRPTLVLRESTERPEAVECGAARLIGTSRDRVVAEVERLLHDEEARLAMARPVSPFGDGRAAEKIAEVLRHEVPFARSCAS